MGPVASLACREDADQTLGDSEIQAAARACAEVPGESQREEAVLELFREARRRFVESLPRPAESRVRLNSAQLARGSATWERSLGPDASGLMEFNRAFDEYPEVHERLKDRLLTVVRATARKGQTGAKGGRTTSSWQRASRVHFKGGEDAAAEHDET